MLTEGTGKETPLDLKMSLESVEEKIRSAPLPSAGVIFLAGIVASRVPVLGIIVALLRLALSLVRPALLLFGLAQLIQWGASHIQEAKQSET